MYVCRISQGSINQPFNGDWWFWRHFVPNLLGYTCTNNYSNKERFDKVIAKNKMVQFFLPHSVVHCNTAKWDTQNLITTYASGIDEHNGFFVVRLLALCASTNNNMLNSRGYTWTRTSKLHCKLHYCMFASMVCACNWLIDWVRLNVPPNTL